MTHLNKFLAAMLLLIAFACQNEEPSMTALEDVPVFMDFPSVDNPVGRINTESGGYAIHSAEYLASMESGRIGQTIFFNDVGNRQLDADFAPGLALDGTDNVSYYVDERRPSADLPVSVTSAAISRAMQTWDGVTCSDLGMFRIPSNNALPTGFVSLLLGFGGSPAYRGDVLHAGWLPAAFFDLLATDGSDFILAVTFTIIFTDAEGNGVDTNGDGKDDVAWREIYYNDAFAWGNGNNVDVETIALHEAGHGLSQDHFGKAFLTNANDKLHFAPRAVMNAAYSGVQREIKATDNGGHCSIWSDWPNQ